MASCRHLNQVKEDLVCAKLWDPSLWMCQDCGTTEDVWVCLSCCYRGCGRDTKDQHAKQHAEEERHPVVMEINSLSTHCYLCDDYAINDTRRHSLQRIRDVLSETATGSPPDSRTRKGTRIRRSSQSKYDLLQQQDVLQFTRMERPEKAEYMDRMLTSMRRWSLFNLQLALNRWTANLRTKPDLAVLPGSNGQARARIKRGRTGLRNIGNTCYLNAVIQALSHITCFRDMFYGGVSAEKVVLPTLRRTQTLQAFEAIKDKQGFARSKKQQAKKPKGSPGEEPVKLFEEVHHLLKVLWSGRYAVATPNSVVSTVWLTNSMFRGFKQQDASEFFVFLIDRLSNELSSMSPPVNLREFFDLSVRTSIVCHTCKHRSTGTLGNAITLAAAFPMEWYAGSKPRSRDSHSLSTMMEQFFATEKLQAENAVQCDHCNRKCDATLHREIVKLPRVLVVQIQRTSFLGGKVSQHVKFPLEGLDMSPYTKGGSLAHTYQLASVVEHHGRYQDRGHYTAYGLNQNSWVCFDDAVARVVLPAEVEHAQALLLFYIKKTQPAKRAAESDLPEALARATTRMRRSCKQ
eukprot:TRINITY_DN8058_c0_g1_i1.p1 TRINITY_DN8058_c0_g1~~TRINITY_DN8058_c0_g1_i1.p1  ORF type:complete len:574 (-),score=108.51 TRINITY_DN8058_c0_g1_i1:361-2082(-)